MRLDKDARVVTFMKQLFQPVGLRVHPQSEDSFLTTEQRGVIVIEEGLPAITIHNSQLSLRVKVKWCEIDHRLGCYNLLSLV